MNSAALGRGRSPQVESLRISEAGSPLADIMAAMQVDAGHQVTYIGSVPARSPSYGTPKPALPTPLVSALKAVGIERLYSHQTAALELARAGQDVVVVTATSSGKTLCYNLPVIERVLADRAAHALYVYPINALVNDQFTALARLNLELGQQAVGIDRYSGSVSSDRRREIRARQPNILLTNPEMLHLSLLQWHHIWETLWKDLRYVVLDEVHTYRGVFGAHIAGLMRRVLRVARHYGASPQFICCSATIANPQELVENLTSRPCQVVDQDGSASGRRLFVMWNPPLARDEGENVRRAYTDESADLLQACLQQSLATIVFTRARRVTEQMLRRTKGSTTESDAGDGDSTPRIASYRAGYMAEEREEIERGLKSGEIQGVISTNALELGIDIGGLDSTIIAGYPGSIVSTWQQAGRAGRRGRDALVFLVASQNLLDQYYASHPAAFFGEPHEQAVVDLENPFIRLRHLLCSAREVPFHEQELTGAGEQAAGDVAALRRAGLLEEAAGAGGPTLSYPPEDRRKALHMLISLRSTGEDTYTIRDEQRHEIGTIQPPNVFRETHPGAIYQHGDEDLRVVALNRYERTVTVRPEPEPHYTRSQSTSNISVTREVAGRSLGTGPDAPGLHLGEVVVTESISAYQELEIGSNRLVRRVNLDSPLTARLHTTGLWIALPGALESLMAGVTDSERREALSSGLHAVQHLLTGLMPMLVMCDRRDIGGESAASHPDTPAAALFLYDAYEGGIGLAEAAFEQVEQLLRLAYDTLRGCSCREGCPSCIQSSTCRTGNDGLDKQAALTILAHLVPQLREQPLGGRLRHQLSASQGRGLDRAIEEIDALTLKHGLRQHAAEVASVAPVTEPEAPRYAVGQWVQHGVYGRGVVIEIGGAGKDAWVTVRFSRRSVIQRFPARSPQLHTAPDVKR